MLETLLESPPAWLDATGPDAAFVVNARGTLSRNLAEFPFPRHCNETDLQTVEQRVLEALQDAGLMDEGRYYALADLTPHEVGVLRERQLFHHGGPDGFTGRGVFVHRDQCLSVQLNDMDHIRIRVLTSGLQLESAWDRLNGVDDALERGLDYAFDDRLGYLTASLALVGTGFQASVLMHLPGVTMAGGLRQLEEKLTSDRHELRGLLGPVHEALGDLLELSNAVTLGRSEEEIVYHVKQHALEVIEEEKRSRELVLAENAHGIEDRVGRALGIAKGARVLDLDEAMGLWSSLRLGLASGLQDGYSIKQLNDLLIAALPAHLEMRSEKLGDERSLNMERAHRFGVSFS
jgi:protein arginine kinase